MPRVAIAGGGLAGLACALSLGRAGFDVILCEAAERLGGKAGAAPASPASPFPYPVEHGPHFFPGWYLNLRHLMAEAGAGRHLVDYGRLTYLMPPDGPGMPGRHVVIRLGSGSLVRRALDQLHNLLRGPLPWYRMMQSGFSALDLMTASLEPPREDPSLLGFFARRWYADDDLAAFHQAHVLRGSAVSARKVSARTIQTLLRLWFRYPDPFLSVLDTDLDTGLIAPLAAALGERVEVRRETPVAGIALRNGRAAGLRLAEGGEVAADFTVAAVPLEVASRFLGAELLAADPGLARIRHLESAPMAVMHVAFKTRLEGVPEGVVYLWGSPLSLNLIDLSRVWTGLAGAAGEREPRRTVLSLVCSDWRQLQPLSREEQAEALLAELSRYLPSVRPELVDGYEILDNVDHPLFINTTGSWADRPDPAGPPFAGSAETGLYWTGDFARNQADVACMESAILAGLETAAAIARRAGVRPGIAPVPLAAYGAGRALLYRTGKLLCAPGAAYARLFGKRRAGEWAPP